jgi:hypothetical protein
MGKLIPNGTAPLGPHVLYIYILVYRIDLQKMMVQAGARWSEENFFFKRQKVVFESTIKVCSLQVPRKIIIYNAESGKCNKTFHNKVGENV